MKDVAEEGEVPPLEWIEIADIQLLGTIRLPGSDALMGVRPDRLGIEGPYDIVLVSDSGVRTIVETDCFAVTGLVAHDWTGDDLQDIVFIGLREVSDLSPAFIGFSELHRLLGYGHVPMAVVLGLFSSTLDGDFDITFREIEGWPLGKRPHVGEPPLIGDFDGDGDKDLAMPGRRSLDVDTDIILLLWEDSTFQYIATMHPTFPGSLFSSDIDRDGQDEILIDTWDGPICILSLTGQRLVGF
jgi:hypothetical protein